MLEKSTVSDLQDRLRYLEDRLKNLDKFDSPPARQATQSTPGKQVRAGVKKDAGPEVARAAGGMAKKDAHATGPAPAMAYGREARSRNAARTNPADFLGEDFMKRLMSVQQESKLTGSKAGDDPVKRNKKKSLEGQDGGMAELNSLYAVVQDIKKDLGQMSTPGSMRASASNGVAAKTQQEPSYQAPELHRARGLQNLALPEPDGGLVNAATEPKAPLRKSILSPQRAAQSRDSQSARLEPQSNVISGLQESGSRLSLPGAEGRYVDEGFSSTHNGGAALERDAPVLPSKAPSVTVPKLNLSTLAPAPSVVLPNVSPQSHDNHGAARSADDAADPSQVAMHLNSPSAGDTSSDGEDLRENTYLPQPSPDARGARVLLLQPQGSDWELPKDQGNHGAEQEEEQLAPIQTTTAKLQRSAGPLLPAPPDADDLQTFANDWEGSVAGAAVDDLEPGTGARMACEDAELHELAPDGGPDVPEVVIDKHHACRTSAAPPPPHIKTDGASGGGPAVQAQAEDEQQPATPARTGPGPDDLVAVKITLDEDYTQLLSTPAKRMQMERMIKEDVADSLRVPRTRIQVVKLEKGSIEAYVNILPSERKNGGPTPDELADMLISQVSDSSSKLRRQMSTRRASKVVKCAPLEPTNTGAPPTPLPPAAFTTPLKRVPEDADASADGSVSLVREAEKGEAVDDSSFGATPLTEGKSISDRMAMFREMERRSGSVPKPQTQVKSGPHFSAPKAALQAHVNREKIKKQEHGDVSCDEGEEPRAALRAAGSSWKSGANDSSLPLLSPPTTLDFTSAASIDRSSSGDAASKGTAAAGRAPQAQAREHDLASFPTAHDDSPRASPEKAFGVVLSSPNMGAMDTSEHAAERASQAVPEMPRAGSGLADGAERDALTPFGVRLKKVPRKYEESPARSPRSADGELAGAGIKDAALPHASPPAAQPPSPRFTIPNFDDGPEVAEEPAPQASDGDLAGSTPGAPPSSEPQLDEDILAQFGLSSAPGPQGSAPAHSSTASDVHVISSSEAAGAEEEEAKSIPSLHEPVQDASPDFGQAVSRPGDVPSPSEEQVPPFAASDPVATRKSFKAPLPPPVEEPAFAAAPPPSVEELTRELGMEEQDGQPPPVDTPQKATEDSLAGLISPLVATADDMQRCGPPADFGTDEIEGSSHVAAAPSPQPREAPSALIDVDPLTLDRPSKPSEETPAAGSQGSAEDIGAFPASAADAASLAEPDVGPESEADRQEDSGWPAAAGRGGDGLGADGESVGLQMVLDEDYDQTMAQWQEAASTATGCAPTLANAKSAFAQRLAQDLQHLLAVPLERVRVLDLQPGSIVASVNLDKGHGPSPVELADSLIHQISSQDPAISQYAILKRCSSVTKCKAFEPLETWSELGAHRDIGVETGAEKRREDDRAPAPESLQAQPVHPRPTRPKRQILQGLGPEFGAVVRRRDAGSRANVTSLVSFRNNGDQADSGPGWFVALLWGSELMGRLARSESPLSYGEVIEEALSCDSAETHRRVKEKLHNCITSRADGIQTSTSMEVENADVWAALSKASADSSATWSLAFWLLLSLTAVEVCVREYLLWLFECKAFASRQEVHACLHPSEAGAALSQRDNMAKREMWEGIVLVLSIGVCLCLQWAFLCRAVYQRSASVISSGSGLMSFLYDKALRSRAWLDGTLSSEAPELWGWSPSEGDGKATLLLNDLLMHDVAQLAQAESYRASVPGACLLSVAAVGLMFREVEISGLGALCAVVFVLSCLALLLAGAGSQRSINIDLARMRRLSIASKLLAHFAATKLLMWHEAAASRLGFNVTNEQMDVDLAAFSSVMISEGLVTALVLSLTGLCTALVAIFQLFVEENKNVTAFELYMVLSLAATMVTPLMMLVTARRKVAACGNSVERVRRFLSQKIEEGAGREAPKTLEATRGESQHELAIQAERCVFEWPRDHGAANSIFRLGEDSDSLSLHVRKGEMVAVVGAAGQGKSSLLHAISGLMPCKQGALTVRGEVAYCGQVVSLLAGGSLRENILFGLPYDLNMMNRVLQCTHCQQYVVDMLPKGLETVIGEEVHQTTIRKHDNVEHVCLSQRQLVLVGLARAVYKDAAIYLLDGVLEALGPVLAPRVIQDCFVQQLCVKTVVLAESLAMAREGSPLEMCNMVYLTGARRSEFGVVAGLVGSGELSVVQQQSDRWHQRHDLDTDVCAVLALQAQPSSWLISRLGEEEASLANSAEQSARWACWWFCAKSREFCVLYAIIAIFLSGHALRVLQDWWLQLLYSSTSSSGLALLNLDQQISCFLLGGSVICVFFLFSSANALWVAIVAVSTTKNLHQDVVSELRRTSPSMPESKQQAVVDLMNLNMRESLGTFPLHVLATAHCGSAALGCLVLLTVEIINVQLGETPPIVRAFVALPVLLLGAGFYRWWTIDHALRQVSYWMAAARSSVRALCATTVSNMQQLRVYPLEGAALLTMQRLLNHYSSAQLAVCAVQTRSVVSIGMLWSLGAMLIAAMLILLREMELLAGGNGMGLAGLVLALLLQVVFLFQWAIISASDGAISFHAYAGRIKSLVRAVVPPEESHMRGSMVKLGDSGVGWSVENVCVILSPSTPAALVFASLPPLPGMRSCMHHLLDCPMLLLIFFSRMLLADLLVRAGPVRPSH